MKGDESGGQHTEELAKWIDDCCRENPSDSFYGATAALTRKFRNVSGIDPFKASDRKFLLRENRGTSMSIMSKETRADRLKRLLDAVEDGKVAMTEYLLAAQATLAKTARLKVLRLAKEAADRKAEAKAKRVAAKKKVAKK